MVRIFSFNLVSVGETMSKYGIAELSNKKRSIGNSYVICYIYFLLFQDKTMFQG